MLSLQPPVEEGGERGLGLSYKAVENGTVPSLLWAVLSYLSPISCHLEGPGEHPFPMKPGRWEVTVKEPYVDKGHCGAGHFHTLSHLTPKELAREGLL